MYLLTITAIDDEKVNHLAKLDDWNVEHTHSPNLARYFFPLNIAFTGVFLHSVNSRSHDLAS